MCSDTAIDVKGLGKRFQPGTSPFGQLKRLISKSIRGSDSEQPSEADTSDDFWALRNISFQVKKGESVGVLGLNGAGKSTLLQIICGTLAPSAGTVFVSGRVAALLELGAGFNLEFSGIENIYLNGAILGMERAQVDHRLEDIIRFAEIGDFVRLPVKTYSSGMFVRLAFSVAIHSDPEILIVDEALAVGDFLFQQKCNHFIREKLPGVSKLLVSHDLGAISSLTSRALVLDKGRVHYYGNTQTAIEKFQIQSRKLLNTLQSRSGEQFVPFGPATTSNDSAKLSNASLESWSNSTVVAPTQLSGSLRARIENYRWSVGGRANANAIAPDDRFEVEFSIDSLSDIENAIYGYQVQDRFGTVIFGGNTASAGLIGPELVRGAMIVRIVMHWPEVADATYSITIGIGAGKNDGAHEIVCWAHNLFTLTSRSKRTVHGMFTNDLTRIEVVNACNR